MTTPTLVPSGRLIELLEYQIERDLSKIAILSAATEDDMVIDPAGIWTATHNGKIMGKPGPSMIKNPYSEITSGESKRPAYDPTLERYKATTRYQMGWTDPRALTLNVNGDFEDDKESREATQSLGNSRCANQRGSM